MGMYSDNPCHKCMDRAIGCHGSCEKYKTWDAELERRKASLGRAKENMMNDMERQRSKRLVKSGVNRGGKKYGR